MDQGFPRGVLKSSVLSLNSFLLFAEDSRTSRDSDKPLPQPGNSDGARCSASNEATLIMTRMFSELPPVEGVLVK